MGPTPSFSMNECRVQVARKKKTCPTIPANPPAWWSTPILPGPSIDAFKPNASAVPRTTIRTIGIAPGGFRLSQYDGLRENVRSKRMLLRTSKIVTAGRNTPILTSASFI
jgi:hypothetical protein